MLSSTYVQVAVVNENRLIKRQLNNLKEKMASSGTEVSGFGHMMEGLEAIYEKCRTARFEQIVLPVVMEERTVSPIELEAFVSSCDQLDANYFGLIDCYALGRHGTGQHAFHRSLEGHINAFVSSVESWLDYKENGFFSWAKGVLSDEKWFEIAEVLMETEGEFREDEWDWPDFYGKSLTLSSDGYPNRARETESRL